MYFVIYCDYLLVDLLGSNYETSAFCLYAAAFRHFYLV